jgi:hypothetical protein
MVSLTGCAGEEGGRTVQQATAALRSVDGVADAEVEMRNYRSGFTSTWGVTIYFTPGDDFTEVDKKTLLERMLRIGWSVNEDKIESGVSIALDDDDQDIDLVQIAEGSGLSGVRRAGNLTSRFTVPSSVLRDEFGHWPGQG